MKLVNLTSDNQIPIIKLLFKSLILIMMATNILIGCKSREERIGTDCIYPTGLNITEIGMSSEWFLVNQEVSAYLEQPALSSEDIASFIQEVYWKDSDGYFYSGIFISQCFNSIEEAISIYNQVKIFYPEQQNENPLMRNFTEFDYVCGYNWQGFYKCNFVGRYDNQVVQIHFDIDGGFEQEMFSEIVNNLNKSIFELS